MYRNVPYDTPIPHVRVGRFSPRCGRDAPAPLTDLAASTDYYTRVLGMAIDFTAPGWTFLSRGSFRLMLGECADTPPAHKTADHSYFAYVTVEGIDQFYD